MCIFVCGRGCVCARTLKQISMYTELQITHLFAHSSSFHRSRTFRTVPFTFWRLRDSNTRIVKPFEWTLQMEDETKQNKTRKSIQTHAGQRLTPRFIEFNAKYEKGKQQNYLQLRYHKRPYHRTILDCTHNIAVHLDHTTNHRPCLDPPPGHSHQAPLRRTAIRDRVWLTLMMTALAVDLPTVSNSN